MSGDELMRRLRAARPPDPAVEDCAPAAVRILARLAVLEAGRRSVEADPRPTPRLQAARQERVRGRGRWVAAAAVLLCLLPGSMASRSADAPPGAAGSVWPVGSVWAVDVAAGDPWAARVAAALEGDALMRVRILRGGGAARTALLHAARAGGVRGRAALDLLRTAGSLRTAEEAAAVASLASDPALRGAALAVLAGDRGPHGAPCLGAVLARVPGAEEAAVAALVTLADRGRREAALKALLQGASKGRRKAAAQAFAIATVAGVGRVVAALPETSRKAPEVLAAVGSARATVRARLLRLADAGDEGALHLAVRARIRGVVPLLATRALDENEIRAGAAVDALALHGGVEAWLALSRALDGVAGGHARRRLEQLPPSAMEALALRAVSAPRDADAAMTGLAAAGDAGVARLAELARRSRWGPGVVAALAKAADGTAEHLLGTLAERPALATAAIAVLGTRLARGRGGAGEVLLALARARHDRAVFRALEAGGAAGRVWLERAGAEPALARRARASLARVDARADTASKQLVRGRGRPAKSRRPEARSI